MSNAKDKRIRKLKKKRIWPSVLGLLLISFIFGIMFLVLMAFASIDVIQRKLIESNSQAVVITNAFETYGSGSDEDIQATVLANIQALPEIETAISSAMMEEKKKYIVKEI